MLAYQICDCAEHHYAATQQNTIRSLEDSTHATLHEHTTLQTVRIKRCRCMAKEIGRQHECGRGSGCATAGVVVGAAELALTDGGLLGFGLPSPASR
jgi:hypothetical protein